MDLTDNLFLIIRNCALSRVFFREAYWIAFIKRIIFNKYSFNRHYYLHKLLFYCHGIPGRCPRSWGSRGLIKENHQGVVQFHAEIRKADFKRDGIIILFRVFCKSLHRLYLIALPSTLITAGMPFSGSLIFCTSMFKFSEIRSGVPKGL